MCGMPAVLPRPVPAPASTISSGHGVSHPLGITAVPNSTLELWFTDSSDNLMSQGILR